MARPALGILLVLLLSACDAEDWPWFEDADAFCEDPAWFDLWAQVAHDRGPRAVTGVWVDVSWVTYSDNSDEAFLDYFGTYELAYQADGQWAAAVESGTTPLDCEYPYEYYFLFTAEDEEGNTTQTDLVN